MRTVTLLVGLIALFSANKGLAQDDLDSNYAVYEGQTFSYMLESPDDWVLNLDEAQHDELSACMFPKIMTYTDAKLAINVWIFKLDSLSLQEFITRDSAFYIKSNSSIVFDKRDSIKISENLYAVALRTNNPGTDYSLAMVAYIDAVTEVIVYELNIHNYSYYLAGAVKLEEALKKFAFIR
ncbi:MAG: hypothetical protein ABIJ45_08285 [Candidatus Zixiibacteriota bacterium]